MTRTKINEQKEYLYGTALQRVGGGEIPAGKYKGNGFVRCKANVKVQVADAVSSRYRGKISKRFRIGLRLCESSRTVAENSTMNKGWHHETYIRP